MGGGSFGQRSSKHESEKSIFTIFQVMTSLKHCLHFADGFVLASIRLIYDELSNVNVKSDSFWDENRIGEAVGTQHSTTWKPNNDNAEAASL